MNQETRERLTQAFSQSLLLGRHYSSITQARAQAQDVLEVAIRPGDTWVKVVDESMEAAVVRVAGAIVQGSETTHRAYDRLVELLQQQPNLGVRTSTSIMQQAYSTPIPIAYLAANLAGITSETTVYEPTAGNGALLINADPRLVFANELNGDRVSELGFRGFGTLTQQNAMTYRPLEKVDRVIANPPFGTIADQNGDSQRFRIYQTWTTQIDQVIAFNALEVMKSGGKAVLILGGKLGRSEEARSTRYHSRESRAFFKQLYDRYNVIDHFSIDGGLYRKQGAGFPIDLIVIDGQGQSDRRLPAADVPEIFSSFTALKEKLPNVSLSRLSSNLDADRERFVFHGQSSSENEPTSAEALPRTNGTAVSLDDESRFSRRRTGLFETDSPPNLSSSTDPDTRPGGLEIGVGHDDPDLNWYDISVMNGKEIGLMSIDRLEQLTGYDFLSNLSSDIQSAIEGRQPGTIKSLLKNIGLVPVTASLNAEQLEVSPTSIQRAMYDTAIWHHCFPNQIAITTNRVGQDFGISKVGTIQNSIFETPKVGSTENSIAGIDITQKGSSQIGFPESNLVYGGSKQASISDNGIIKFGTIQKSPSQIGSSQISPSEVSSSQYRSSQVDSAQVEFNQIDVGLFAANQLNTSKVTLPSIISNDQFLSSHDPRLNNIYVCHNAASN